MQKKIRNLIMKLSKKLEKKNWSLVLAESCTGGGLAHYISQLPDCSSVLERALVTYSDESKNELLQVKKQTIQQFGAVSMQTAREMAKGALANSRAQFSIAITGLAGPDKDDTSDKPIGTVYISCASIRKKPTACKKNYAGGRKKICERSIEDALKYALKLLS